MAASSAIEADQGPHGAAEAIPPVEDSPDAVLSARLREHNRRLAEAGISPRLMR
jgi:hypothetical protein